MENILRSPLVNIFKNVVKISPKAFVATSASSQGSDGSNELMEKYTETFKSEIIDVSQESLCRFLGNYNLKSYLFTS